MSGRIHSTARKALASGISNAPAVTHFALTLRAR